MIRVLVVDDSPFICHLLTSYLRSSPEFEVVGTALDGAEAVALTSELSPDVVTMDLNMPQMDGLEALQRIMYDHPTPVVMISGVSSKAARTTLEAVEMGAVDFVLKYTPDADTNPNALRLDIISKVRAAAGIKVVRSLRPYAADSPRRKVKIKAAAVHRSPILPYLPGGVIVIGASTGGPVAVRELLAELPADIGAAIIVVQHIPASFTPVLAAQLDRRIALSVKEARTGDKLKAGQVLIAPGNFHLLIRPNSRIRLNQGQKIKGHRPSIDVTMQSVAQVYGAQTRGVVLTGMGDDGSLGLVAIRAKGGKTFAQNRDSCVINGMPQRARERGVVDFVADPPTIARILMNTKLGVGNNEWESAA